MMSDKMSNDELKKVADRLFTAFLNGDLDTVATMLTPDAVLTQNGQSLAWGPFREVLTATISWIGDFRYEDVRRTYGLNTIVEEHAVRSTRTDGTEIELAACVVVRVDQKGKISSIDEYVDTASLL